MSAPAQKPFPPGRASHQRTKLGLALALVVGYMAAEVVGGLASNSLALLADAGHMLADAAALGLSLFAMWAAERPATPRRTFGFHRMEILAALANGAALIAVSALISFTAYGRWAAPPPVKGGLMLAVACGGLAVNLAALLLLGGVRGESLNVRGAWLHVLTDTLGSVQAIVAAVLISALGWTWADPLASVLIALLVIFSAWSLLKESVAILMEGVPTHIALEDVVEAMTDVAGVVAVHDMHIWTITSGFVSLSAHVVVEPACDEDVLWRVRQTLHERFGIDHSTIQVEKAPSPGRITPTRTG